MKSLNEVEIRAVELLGREKLESVTSLINEYTCSLNQALDEFGAEGNNGNI